LVSFLESNAMPKIIPLETYDRALELIASGTTFDEAARACGLGKGTLQSRARQTPGFVERLRAAQAKGREAQKAQRGLKTRTPAPAAAAPTAVAPATVQQLPTVRPVAIGVLKGDVLFVEPSQLARVLALARSAAV